MKIGVDVSKDMTEHTSRFFTDGAKRGAWNLVRVPQEVSWTGLFEGELSILL